MLHRPSTTSTSVRRALATLAVVGLMTGACDDGDEPDGGTTVDDTGADLDDDVDDLDDLDDELGEILSTLDVETVDDVEIVHDEGSDVTRIGGLAIAVPVFAEFVDLGTDRHTLIPPSWPTSRKRTEIHDADSALPTIAWTVFRQNELVTDDEARAVIDAQLWELAQAPEGDIVHASTLVGDTATCRTELRSTPNANRGPTLNGVIYFSGPGLASSAMLSLGGDGDEQRAFIGDVVEAACGERPAGL